MATRVIRVRTVALLAFAAVAAAGCGAQESPQTPPTSPARSVGSLPAPATKPAAPAGAQRRPGANCMADPSRCGFPNVGTTGVEPGVERTVAKGTVQLSKPGEVYENKTLTGQIIVTAPRVTIRNVKLIMTDAYWGIRAFAREGNTRGLEVENSEIDMNGQLAATGIGPDQFTASRVFIHNGSDCISMQSVVTVTDSLCVVGPDANGDGVPDNRSFCTGGGEHFDGFQSDGGHDFVLRHNTIRNPCEQTSAILMSTNSAPIRDVTIKDNLIAGGGWTLYCNAGPDVPNEVVTGNRIAKTYFDAGGSSGPAAHCGDADTFTGNVWDDSGRPVGL
jgi:hypothetical protein